MKTVFISNYINHHQIPFSEALYGQLGGDYHFIQTEPMEAERAQMGWTLDAGKLPYVVCSYEREAYARQLIEEADLVLAGWTKRTDLFLPRLKAGKLTLRISERIYREGQWKALSPRGLLAKYREHVRFRRAPVYLLCNGAYVASDFALIGAYPDKKFQFGYFPPLRTYEGDSLFAKKKTEGGIHMIWAGRMIALKHPEFVTRLAAELAAEGYDFHIHMVGSGPMEAGLKQEVQEKGLSDSVTFYGFMEPERVRDLMERCRIFLFTSNYLEGWGAVLNEAMNSGCCVVANRQIGAVPFLVEDNANGLSYDRGEYEAFARQVKYLLEEPEETERMGRAAYRTIAEEWNADCAARRCLAFYEGWKNGHMEIPQSGPFARAKRLSAGWKYDQGTLE